MASRQPWTLVTNGKSLGHRMPIGAENPQTSVKQREVYRFGRFQVFAGTREIWLDDCPIELGSRSFDLLIFLLEARGRVVSKEEIFAQVWPHTVVEEGNLRLQISILRKALGEDRDAIKTVQGRGYVFVADVVVERAEDLSPREALAPVAPTLLVRLDPVVAEASDSSLLQGSEFACVAVIDDDPGTRDALEGLLRSSGLSVETYASVQEFIDQERKALPRCLVLDVLLPGRGGLEFQSDLVKAGISLPVIFISGHADVHMSVRAMKAGAFEFLTKPVRYQELLDAVKSAVVSPKYRNWPPLPPAASSPQSTAEDGRSLT